MLASVLKGIFGDVGGFSPDELGLSAPTTSADGGGGGGGAIVKPVKVTVFSPEGEADAPDAAPLAIDGNTSTVWPIDTYSDPVPFPNFKNGVGLMLQLPQPTTVGEVTIDLNSTGTSVEIRSAQTPTPSSLSDTTVLTPATPLSPAPTPSRWTTPSPTSNLLVWVSTLGQVNGESRSDIAEITAQGGVLARLSQGQPRPERQVSRVCENWCKIGCPGVLRVRLWGAPGNCRERSAATPSCLPRTSRVTATPSRNCSTATTASCTGWR